MKKEFSLNEINDVAKEVLAKARGFSSTHPGQATLITLSGDLGAGKTALTQAIARELGVIENIISPTYIIMKNYPLRSTLHDLPFTNLVHIDAYRTESDDEFLRLGWEKIINDPKNLILLEWPERVENVLPKEKISIALDHINEQMRSVDIL